MSIVVYRLKLFGFLLGLVSLGCARDGHRAEEAVLVLVAASAGPAVSQIAADFEGATGTLVRVSSAASNLLTLQLKSGAPGHIFLPAHVEWLEELADADRIEEWAPLVGNRLALVVPAGNPAAVMSVADLASERVKRVALAGETVPAGRYAEQSLRAARVYSSLLESGRVVRAHNARSALTFVAQGEVDAGVVYETDAKSSSSVELVGLLDSSSHSPAVYPVALLHSARAVRSGRAFYDHLRSDEAGEGFARYGFRKLPPDPAPKAAGR